MEADQIEELMVENTTLQSVHLKREVKIDIYRQNIAGNHHYNLLFVNDGQDLVTMNFAMMFDGLQVRLKPLIVVAIHCSADRKMEYGMSAGSDYKGSGAKASFYEKFIVKELLPYVIKKFNDVKFSTTSFAGFSLGGLSAFDIAWNNSHIFSMAAVFSGSLWWRSVNKNDKDYNPWEHRMMHKQVKKTDYRPGMKFFFECGEMDEHEDRNKNGVIDSIDDTIDLMRLLVQKGYREGKDLHYLQMADGKHDVPSWSRALPFFLEWAYAAVK